MHKKSTTSSGDLERTPRSRTNHPAVVAIFYVQKSRRSKKIAGGGALKLMEDYRNKQVDSQGADPPPQTKLSKSDRTCHGVYYHGRTP